MKWRRRLNDGKCISEQIRIKASGGFEGGLGLQARGGALRVAGAEKIAAVNCSRS